MEPCVYCGNLTATCDGNGRPVCGACADSLQSAQAQVPLRKPVQHERRSLEPEERARIATILYNEVIRAQQNIADTSNVSPETNKAAQTELERAVRRYTDFTRDGRVPEDLEARLSAAPFGDQVA